ncbi:LysE family translocator [Marixanthomonas ophiurae]|uniref:LysE family translocator n=1 Tax=Marixanthomonas ophiurae TaxID=387659 RepID=A0A3E1QDG2_9FLAO|nr:LysE family translocator [Marixanthomonas ophiurae]RFN60188.1 LysE family translocator [Marixanthomonas ophiurae]
MTENLLSFALATMALAFSPGPDNIYVLTQSLVNGVKSGIATTAGLVTGCIVHTTFLAFGLSAIITASPALFYGVKVLGALYLLYLAYVVFKSDASIAVPITSEGKINRTLIKTNAQLFKQGVIMNLVNPKVMIFFLAFFPAFLWNETENTVSQFYILGIIFMVISFLVFGLIAFLAGSISSYILKHKSVGIVLKWLQIVVFIGIAVFILIP